MNEHDIAYELAMLEAEVLFYKMMVGALAKSLATDDNDVFDKEYYKELQTKVADNCVIHLSEKGAEKCKEWVDRNVFSFRVKLAFESKNSED